MTDDEAAKAGAENRRYYFRVNDGKSNLAPPVEKADWYKFASVEIGNGDNVGVVTRWKWPDAFEGVTVADLRKVQDAIASGRWRESSQAKDWAGNAVARVLRLDATNKAHKAKITALLKTWTANGMLRVVEAQDEKRMMRSFIEVGEAASD
jgi:hypothetical protein